MPRSPESPRASSPAPATTRRLALVGALATIAVLGYLALGPGGAPPAPASSAAASAPATPASPAASSAERKIVGAAHVLVAYRGALRAPPTVERTRDEARKRAEEALATFRAGKASFEEIVKRYSDDESTKPTQGDIGNFEHLAMPEAFSNTAFGLSVGETSGVVETPLGFHIIQRKR